MKTQTKRIREAIEPTLNDWNVFEHIPDVLDRKAFMVQLTTAIKPLMKKELPTDAETEAKVQAVDDMIKHVEGVMPKGTKLNYGSKKWEKAIKYLINVKNEYGWDFKILWIYIHGDERKFETNRISVGSLMGNPDEQLKIWMPIAHATKTDTTQSYDEKLAAAGYK